MKRVEYKGYYIDKTKTGYRVSNKNNTSIHTHIKNKNPCFKLIDNVNLKIIPRKCSLYYLESHLRLSYDENYIRKIKEYMEVKKNKTHQKYFNPHKKKF